jgi:hypothetical protein
MLHGLALTVALTSATCTMPPGTLPFFTTVSPPYNSEVQSGPMTVQVQARGAKLADPWTLVSDLTLVGTLGASLRSTGPEVHELQNGSVASFFFARVPGGQTYRIELHWREPLAAGCPPAKWTSLMGEFTTY